MWQITAHINFMRQKLQQLRKLRFSKSPLPKRKRRVKSDFKIYSFSMKTQTGNIRSRNKKELLKIFSVTDPLSLQMSLGSSVSRLSLMSRTVSRGPDSSWAGRLRRPLRARQRRDSAVRSCGDASNCCCWSHACGHTDTRRSTPEPNE